ncbi:MAG: gamma-glutamyl-gamma-aminobutyrate hydrolase family protein [bacterium]|nr:gamma-glutamyl-gamma-aminobutyrate hydrolase family protein [bacterium]
MKPIIGISGSIDNAGKMFVHENYIKSVYKAGGIPIILPHVQDEYILNNIQGMVLIGGDDIPSNMFGEETVCSIQPEKNQRLQHDLWLIQKLKEKAIPTLGICYGMQIVNVALGGTLYQDIQTQHPQAINHLQKTKAATLANDLVHSVTIKPSTTLASILNNHEKLMVNSTHHQAVKDVGMGLMISAISPDGIIEAIESLNEWFLGIQWHPEKMDNESSIQIFSYLVATAGRAHQSTSHQCTGALMTDD